MSNKETNVYDVLIWAGILMVFENTVRAVCEAVIVVMK